MGDPNIRACILPDFIPEALNKADCVQIRSKLGLATAEYICWLLNIPSTLIMAAASILGQTRSRISMGRLQELIVPVPPLNLQSEFASRVSHATVFLERQAKSSVGLESLFQSMIRRAFSGELTAKWREAHMKELLAEMEIQNRELGIADTQKALSF